MASYLAGFRNYSYYHVQAWKVYLHSRVLRRINIILKDLSLAKIEPFAIKWYKRCYKRKNVIKSYITNIVNLLSSIHFCPTLCLILALKNFVTQQVVILIILLNFLPAYWKYRQLHYLLLLNIHDTRLHIFLLNLLLFQLEDVQYHFCCLWRIHSYLIFLIQELCWGSSHISRLRIHLKDQRLPHSLENLYSMWKLMLWIFIDQQCPIFVENKLYHWWRWNKFWSRCQWLKNKHYWI